MFVESQYFHYRYSFAELQNPKNYEFSVKKFQE